MISDEVLNKKAIPYLESYPLDEISKKQELLKACWEEDWKINDY
jgi:hypothetical protein